MADIVDDAVASLEDYLRRYPSGHFAELAQLRLDRLLALKGEKRAQVISDAANPFGKGAIAADTDYRVGDRYVFRIIDLYTNAERSISRQEVTAVSEFEVTYNKGRFVNDRLGNPRLQANGNRVIDDQTFPAEYAIGKKWSSRIQVTQRDGLPDTMYTDYVVVAREEVEVPAGRFDAFRVEGEGYTFRTANRRVHKYWVAPQRVRRPVLSELWYFGKLGRGPTMADRLRHELMSFREQR